ncbi:glycosyltransferase family 2 protein [Oceanobacter sp. 4_MG-2023]|uniref:glycosyltransferase family 2 protein n=1 Tax=Oceanobacter sp. 4_MG-2023 TaxID=3062623 RepID=UPI0027329759|nr:glycosyltransferase family 2 protein [Oceanobacter sp. 4_MG-2023]MDP2546560.1 glycosyltransferase family 2 protein [Oceanobacter sp. 4_MG-2023]
MESNISQKKVVECSDAAEVPGQEKVVESGGDVEVPDQAKVVESGGAEEVPDQEKVVESSSAEEVPDQEKVVEYSSAEEVPDQEKVVESSSAAEVPDQEKVVESGGAAEVPDQEKVVESSDVIRISTLPNEITAYYNVIKESGLLEEDYYISAYGDCAPYEDAVLHYLMEGASKYYNPSQYFSTTYYLASNADVKNSGVNPLYHYICYGEKEGRAPNAFFSPSAYLRLNPDLESFGQTLLLHYHLYGRKEGRFYSDSVSVSKKAASPYDEWINKHESEPFQYIVKEQRSFAIQPLISIVVPVYNPDREFLAACIESVMAQSYENWELCLADDQSTKPHVREVLESYQTIDSRIKVVFREKNGHISAASNSALEVATGEWTALLDHDDLLQQHALFYVVKALNDNENVSFVYSDEDKVDEAGNRIDPHFKSDWNPDLLYGQNYVSHLGVYQTDIIKRIGGFRVGYEGSQDYDLLLRYSREIDQKNIVHIPRVLYHWRILEGSTAMGSDEKPYTTDAGIKALEDHFAALGKNVKVEKGKYANLYKISWPSVDENGKEPLVSLIIPTHNGRDITQQAIDSILEKSTYQNFEILLVDNNSNDPEALAYFDEVGQHPKVTLLKYPYPFNYSAINNFAAKKAKGSIIGLINNDVEVITPDWLTEMVSHAQREDIGCVGAMLYYHNDTIQHAGVIIGLGGVAGHSHKHFPRNHAGYFRRLQSVQNLTAVTAACLLIRKSVFDEVNGLNEKDLTVAFNDVDFCLKVNKAGYRNLWTPYAELYHYESISRGEEDNPEKLERFRKEIDYMRTTWETDGYFDRYYNPHLTIGREDFSIGD